MTNRLKLAAEIWKFIDEQVLNIPNSHYLAMSDEEAINGIADRLPENCPTCQAKL